MEGLRSFSGRNSRNVAESLRKLVYSLVSAEEYYCSLSLKFANNPNTQKCICTTESPGPMPERCEVVEMRNLADAVGYPCSRTASKECSDCGIQLCEDHVEACGGCHAVFCPSCLTFHQDTKPASADHGVRERKRA